jgi:tetratricopeptide (TPR) repeat protein
VKFLFSKGLVKTQAIEKLRNNKTINEPTRQKALALLEEYWTWLVHQQAPGLVASLFGKPIFKREVLQSIRTNKAISEEVRQEALGLVENWHGFPFGLAHASRETVAKPGADPAAKRLALLRAEEACRLAPDNGVCLNTLGLAQYRLGHFKQAVETLSRSKELNFNGSLPADLAFLAMAHWRLGEKDKAKDYLNLLRESVKKPLWVGHPEAHAFLREAEALLKNPGPGAED